MSQCLVNVYFIDFGTTVTIEVCESNATKVCSLCGVLELLQSITIQWIFFRCRQSILGTTLTMTTILPNDGFSTVCEVLIHYSQ